MLALALVLAVLIGLSLGMLGGGGSILTVPTLVYALGMEPKEAIATSLLVVAVTSAAATIAHARAGRVRWRTGAVFGAAGMLGAYVGGRLAAFIPGTVLLLAFALMMLATGAAMLKGRRQLQEARENLPFWKVVLDGVLVGLVTGLVGAGGGFLVVPALALLGGLPMSVAVGTSLLVIAMKSTAGLAGYLSSVPIDWSVGLGIASIAVVGSWFGERVARLLSERALRSGFGVFVLAMASFMLLRELPAPWNEGSRWWLAATGILLVNLLLIRGALRAGRATHSSTPLSASHARP